VYDVETTEPADPPGPTLAQSETEGQGRIGYGRYARYSPLGLALVIALVVGAIWWWQSGDGDDSTAGAFAGKPAPAVTLTTFSGNTVELADLQGSVVVVNFWAEWCAPCKEEMPAFQEVYEQTMATGEPVVILGVNLKSDREENALRLLDELGITYITGPDEGGDDPLHGPIQQAFGIPDSYPSTLFIRPDGVIDSIRIGPMDVQELRERIRAASR
jgi:thiol-disulfide isomerase/thioredoxin